MADDVIKIEGIVDKDSLESWLTNWPVSQGLDEKVARQVAVTIAQRAIMRVMPFWWEFSLSEEARERDFKAFPVLRSLLISGVAAKSPTPEMYAAHAAAYAATDVHAAHAAATEAANAAFVAYADAAYAHAAVVWGSIRADCTAVSAGIDLFTTPLWASQRDQIADQWALIKLQVSGSEWAFWIKWYDDALAGRAPNWEILKQIALIESEVWDAGPVAVADAIASIEAKFDLQKPAKPNATVIQNAVAQNLPAIPPQLEALIETIDAEIERLRGRNPKDDLEKQDLDQLKKTFETMRGAVAGLSKMLPTQGAPAIEAAEEMGGLLQVYQSELLKWSRENAADLVDSSCRVVLIGLTAGVLTTFGLPALASTAVAGIAFGGKKLVGIGKALKDATPTSG